METKELEKELEDIKGRIITNCNNTEAAEKRKVDALARQEGLQPKYEAAREKRQLLLALGKDPSQVNKQLSELKDQVEVVEDEIIGLDKRLADLADEKKDLEANLIETEQNILRSKLRPLAAVYNKKAEELAAIVKEIWGLRLKLNERNSGFQTIQPSEGWDDNALSCIPKLFLHDEPIPAYLSSAGCFFKYRTWRQDTMREMEENKAR